MQKILETLSLLILISLVALRPLVSETYDPAVDTMSSALQGVSDPSPFRTLIFDLMVWVAALCWLIARAVSPSCRRYRRTGLEWGTVILAAAAVISCFFAGNQRLAINGALDWLCYPILTITLVQLLHRSRHRSLLLAVIIAGACAQSVECLDQYFVGFEDTWKHYESIKEDFWARQGVDVSDPKVALFENRILAREATGFLPHSNITGSYLVLCTWAAIGLIVSCWKRFIKVSEPRVRQGASSTSARADSYHKERIQSPSPTLEKDGTPFANRYKQLLAWIGLVVTVIILVTAIVLTKSLGAWIAGAAGITMWLILYRFRHWISNHRSKSIVIGWLCFLFVALAVIGHGLVHDALPGWSLTFRWQYWRNTAGMIADHPLTGVGRENFGRHYLLYKSIESPEEVANPHNLFLQTASDWGLPGLIGLMLMLAGASFVITRSLAPFSKNIDHNAASPSRFAPLCWTFGLVIVVVLVRLPLLGSNDPNFLYYRSMMTILPWLAAFLCFLFLLQPNRGQSLMTRRALRNGVAIGLFAFLLHDMINFAAFVPATATVFFSMLAYCIAQSNNDSSESQQPAAWHRWYPVGMAIAVIALLIYFGVLPVGQATLDLNLARRSAISLAPVPLSRQLAGHHYDHAANVDPRDPTPLVEKTEWLMSVMRNPAFREEAFVTADKTLQKAIRRDPHSIKVRRLRIMLYREQARNSRVRKDYLSAITAAEDALELYPQDPQGLAMLADCFYEGGVVLDAREWIEQARIHYQNALQLDDQRLSWETLQRFSKKQFDYLQERLNHAKQILQDRSE